jgi:hypothetical protein
MNSQNMIHNKISHKKYVYIISNLLYSQQYIKLLVFTHPFIPHKICLLILWNYTKQTLQQQRKKKNNSTVYTKKNSSEIHTNHECDNSPGDCVKFT